MSQLHRFTQAQESPHDGFAAALQELQSGGKRGHWIWYIFPQLAGLGSSEASRHFGIRDEAEAVEYLRDPVLGARYRDVTAAVAAHLRRGTPLAVLMGSEIDARKAISSLTLFGQVARRLCGEERTGDRCDIAGLAEDVLAVATRQGYEPCAFTQSRLNPSKAG
jgi:uncharacterized protein (DUF1810 family)